MLNLYTFLHMKESSRGLVMNLGDEYQNFLVFISLLIVDHEGWASNLDDSHHICFRWRNWVGTKLKDPLNLFQRFFLVK